MPNNYALQLGIFHARRILIDIVDGVVFRDTRIEVIVAKPASAIKKHEPVDIGVLVEIHGRGPLSWSTLSVRPTVPAWAA